MNRFLCWLLGHKYYIIHAYSPLIRHVGCARCKREWGMHDELHCLVEWDEELEEASKVAWPISRVKEVIAMPGTADLDPKYRQVQQPGEQRIR